MALLGGADPDRICSTLAGLPRVSLRTALTGLADPPLRTADTAAATEVAAAANEPAESAEAAVALSSLEGGGRREASSKCPRYRDADPNRPHGSNPAAAIPTATATVAAGSTFAIPSPSQPQQSRSRMAGQKTAGEGSGGGSKQQQRERGRSGTVTVAERGSFRRRPRQPAGPLGHHASGPIPNPGPGSGGSPNPNATGGGSGSSVAGLRRNCPLGGTKQAQGLVRRRRGLVVPLFQRRYCWSGNQIEKFVADVVVQTQRQELGQPGQRRHRTLPPFHAGHSVGRICVATKPTIATASEPSPRPANATVAKSEDTVLVLDGQQRLTTTCLMLAVLRDMLELALRRARTQREGSGQPRFRALSASGVSPMEQHAVVLVEHAVALVDELDALLFHVDPRDSDSDSANGLGTTLPSSSVPAQSRQSQSRPSPPLRNRAGTRRDSWTVRSRLRPTLLDRDSYDIAITGGTVTDDADGSSVHDTVTAGASTATTSPVAPKDDVEASAEATAGARARCSGDADAAADGVLAARASLWRLLSSRQAIDRINAKIGADVPAISGFESTSAEPPQDGDRAAAPGDPAPDSAQNNDARELALDAGGNNSDRALQGGKGVGGVGVVDPAAATAELTATLSAVLSVSAALLDAFTVLWFEVAETDVWSVYERLAIRDKMMSGCLYNRAPGVSTTEYDLIRNYLVSSFRSETGQITAYKCYLVPLEQACQFGDSLALDRLVTGYLEWSGDAAATHSNPDSATTAGAGALNTAGASPENQRTLTGHVAAVYAASFPTFYSVRTHLDRKLIEAGVTLPQVELTLAGERVVTGVLSSMRLFATKIWAPKQLELLQQQQQGLQPVAGEDTSPAAAVDEGQGVSTSARTGAGASPLSSSVHPQGGQGGGAGRGGRGRGEDRDRPVIQTQVGLNTSKYATTVLPWKRK